ncbi:AAA family ATPase [Pelosinus propionicus]|uniref:Peptidase family M41 n=1 Tax=Pelosinus propionicus DSM 13327 TaxID=1123291 RepID=A0A1I4JI92_9FIRM|nr:AAA family ATPase [Pelosinus propionicus]SFL66295.1 Peptidase family M41 [Pelosinus propionicus DSM 13327]
MYLTELGIGVTTGLLLFMLWQGYDSILLFFIVVLAVTGIYFYYANGTKRSFAVNKKKRSASTLIQFDDIGGQEVAKQELREAVEFIKDSSRLSHLGIRPIKGVLLNGPPGTGKTLLAKAAAQFTDSVFLSASGSEFVEMYVGVGAQRVRELFQSAKSLAKQQRKDSAILFIDELDILGGKRGQNAGNAEYDQTLNELLVQMDGLSFDDSIKILIIGATNRIDILDSALLRPGRFDRHVKVELPDKKGRLHILRLHTKNKPLASDVSLETLARNTFGFSGAHLESLTNEAAILALREEKVTITSEHFQSAIDKVIMGEKLDRRPNTLEKERIAIHEAGHALVSEITRPGSVATINIASRSNALGYVRQTTLDDTYLYTLDVIKNKIAVALAGAIAEEINLGNRSTGASNDFKQAIDLAKEIIHNGLSTLGIISAEDLAKDLLHATITSILKEVERYVYTLLLTHQATLQAAVTLLLEKEYLDGDDFRLLLATTS